MNSPETTVRSASEIKNRIIKFGEKNGALETNKLWQALEIKN